ncbi:MAG: hypothetical protein HY578_10025 [Nitrospinae bacterium]|nr:hypothetical protein [Nitrospinota bacterium]
MGLTIESIQNVIRAYNQQLKFKERLSSIKKHETEQVQKDTVTISNEGKKLLEKRKVSKPTSSVLE